MALDTTPMTEAQVRHLYKRTSFGGLVKQRDIDKKVGKPRNEVVDDLVDFRPNKYRPKHKSIRGVHDKWFNTMRKTKRQLQERMVLFWHDHFATSDDVVNDPAEMAQQNRTMRIHCIGAFLPRRQRGSFKDFVKAINKDPAMMDMLDTRDNRKEQPNENYARELMELFTLGVFDAAGNPNYSETDIAQIARAFTGWRVTSKKDETYFDGGTGETDGGANCSNSRTGRHDYIACFPDREGGVKVIFRDSGGFGPAGRDFTVNGEGAAEIDTVTDIIFEHTDTDGKNTVARYVGKRLFEHFAYTNPNIAVVDEIIEDSGFDSHFLVQEFLRYLFCHEAFYSTMDAPATAANKSVRWPADYMLGTMRLLKMKPKGKISEMIVDGGSKKRVYSHMSDMGQLLLEPPTVFGWDLEDGWLSSSTMLGRFNFAKDIVSARGRGASAFRPEKLLDFDDLGLIPDATRNAAIVDAVTRLLQVDDQMSATERDALITYLGGIDGIDLEDYDERNTKLNGLFMLVLQSPAYQLY